MRLFIAIDPPEAVRNTLAMMCCGLPGARWVLPEQLHLTLRFIGDIDAAVLSEIIDALDAVASDPFQLSLAGTGCFPPRGKPRVLWAGVEKNEALDNLHDRIESRLRSIGLDPEKRKFFPHITLARLGRVTAGQVGNYLSQHGLFFYPPFAVEKFCIYASVLHPGGARHYLEQEFWLTGRE